MVNWKKHIIGELSWFRLLRTIIFTYFSILIIGLFFSDLLIHHPPASGKSYAESDPHIKLLEGTNGRKVATCYLRAKPGMPTLFWSHGNGEDIGYLLGTFHSLNNRGYGILAYDYPGYGISEGKPSEKACYAACLTAWKHLTEKINIPAEQTIIFGQSLGSGPAVWLATQQKSSALILISPFTSAFRAATHFPLFPGDQFKNIDRISAVKMPLLIIHGKKDKVIAQWHGKKLHELHAGPKTFVDLSEAGHNDIFLMAEKEIFDSLDAFCEEHFSQEK